MLSIEVQDGTKQSMYAYHDHMAQGSEIWQVQRRIGNEKANETVDNIRMADMLANYLKEGFTRFVLHLEDTILVCPEPGVLVAFDVITGTYYRCDITTEQTIAICKLAIGDDDIPDAAECYTILENVLAKWPDECRPVP